MTRRLAIAAVVAAIISSSAEGAIASTPRAFGQATWAASSSRVSGGRALQQGSAGTGTVVDAVSPEEAAALIPGFHITPPSGWMNDPNGMFQNPADGLIHVFYQWNPLSPTWGPPSWGHVVSHDLAHWTRLPEAFVPDSRWDYDGAFSGSATVGPDGSPIIFYTGVTNFSELGYFYQRQGSAVPVYSPPISPAKKFSMYADTQLVRWVKGAAPNPGLSLPPGANHSNWRDPTTAWRDVSPRHGGAERWFLAVGVQPYCVGAAGLYSSPDLQAWEYEGTLYSQVAQQRDGTCAAPQTNAAAAGACNQFGADCRMWEGPDFFNVSAPGSAAPSGVLAFKWSDQISARNPYGQDYYVLGNAPLNYAAAANGAAFTGTLNGQLYKQRVIDYGSVYASKTFQLQDGRRIWYGWVFETAAGCVQQCSSGTNFTRALKRQGAQTVPRQVSLDAAAGALILYPVAEIALLRRPHPRSVTAALRTHSDGTFREVSVVTPQRTGVAGAGRQWDIVAHFDFKRASGIAGKPFRYSAGVILLTGGASCTVVGLDGEATFSSGGSLTLRSASVTVDRADAGGASNTTAEGGPAVLPSQGLAIPAGSRTLELRVLVDHSLIEAYGLQGRARVASRIYPLGSVTTSWGVSMYGSAGEAAAVTGTAVVHAMNSAFS